MSKKSIKTLLVVEDNSGDARLLREMLHEQGAHNTELMHVECMSEAEKYLAHRAVDLILLDLGLPDAKGLEAVRRARASAPRVPLVVLTGLDDETLATQALQAGAQDYLIKGQIETRGLLRALRYAVERKIMEEALLAATAAACKSEEQYRLLFEANPSPMWVFDGETLRFLAVNSAAGACYGFSKQEFLEMTINDIHPDAELDRLNAGIEKRVQDLQFAEPWKHKKKDGTLIDVEITSRHTTFDGRPAKLVLAQDVTLRKRLEETLRQKQKVEAIALLTSGVAHDFNNLLGIILGCTELALLRIGEDSPAASKLVDVQSAAHRAARLTRQLMLFSRQDITEARTVDLNESVAGSEQFLRRVIGEDIIIVCAFAKEPLNIRIDPSHLEQLLLNLVVNARDAMPEGGRIRIETALADLSSGLLDRGLTMQLGSYALLTLSDTGHGMDPETRSKIFEPFFTTKEKGKGTGLGLATCDGIVNQAGGHITVDSELGAGTTFKIFLPLTSAPCEEPAFVEKPVALANGETILVTEDEPALRRTTVESLEESGYTVLQAASGAEAIAIVDRRHGAIDLLLSDVIMPVMSGAELSQRVTQKYPNVHVLLMTGYSDDTLSRHRMPHAARVIQKPFTRHTLLQKVRTLLDATKAISQGYKILLAEDDPMYRELMSDILQASGFEVLCAEDGTGTLLPELAQGVDLAILDIEMPRMRGLSAYQKLQSYPSTALIPVLFVSGNVSTYNKELILRTGVDAFLRKPFGREELLSSVKALLSGKVIAGAYAPAANRSTWLFGGEAGM